MSKTETYSDDALGYYRIIGVNSNVEETQAKLKYRERAKLWHPDHNSSDEAKENFQKLSVAYDIISNADKRLTYDLLCSAYPTKKMPPLFSLKVYQNKQGIDDFNLKAVSLQRVVGKLVKEDIKQEDFVCNYSEAIHEVFKTSLNNWLLGWWSPKAFLANIRAIVENFKKIGHNRQENYRLWVHNALAYWQNKQIANAYISTILAGQYASEVQKKLLKKLLAKLVVQPKFKLKSWNILTLQLVQLIVPVILFVGASIPFATKIVSESDLLSYFAKEKNIIYNQEVRFSSGSRMSDDMVVGKIIKVTVDLADINGLYHLKAEEKVMYGPSDDFDVLKTLPEGTTVRITGISPDDVWYRIMLDEGEMGFVKKEALEQGIGKDIPFGSQIYKP